MKDQGPPRAAKDESARVSEAHVGLAVAAAGLGLWRWDVPAGLFTIDDRFAGMLGRPELAITPFDAQMVAEMTHPEDREMVARELSETLKHDEHVFRTTHRAIRPDGELVWLRARAAVVERDDDGAPLRVAGVVEDCTPEQTDKLEREAEQRRTELVLEASAAGVWDWDVRSGEVFWSETLRAMLGVPPDEAIGFESLKAFIHPDDCALFEGALIDHLQNGAPYGLQLRMLRRDGGELTVRVRGKAERDEAGAPTRMAGSIVDISETSKAQDAALTADARARLALNAAGLILVEQDLNSGEVDVSADLAGLIARPELVGQRVPAEVVWTHLHPEDRARITARFEEFQSGDLDQSMDEFRIMRADGHERWLSIHTVRPRTADDRSSGRLIAVITDLTERKTAELALQREKQRYDLAVAGAHMAIWEWRPGCENVTWSARFNDMIGLPIDYPGESIPAFNARVHRDDVRAMMEAAQDSARTGAPYECEFRVRHAGTGDWLMVRSRASAELDEDGAARRIAGTLTDVTALHAARETADREARRVQLAVDAAGLATFDFDFDRNEMTGSARFAEIIGEPKFGGEPIPLAHLLDIIHPDDREAAKATLEQARAHAQDFVSEHRIIQPDGAVRWTLTLATPTSLDEDGAVLTYTGVVQDLTERKTAELALAEANDRFERAVEGSLISIWDWDLTTGRVHWSQRLYELLQLDETDRIETIQDVSPLVHPDDLDRLREAQRRHFEEHAPFELEYRMFRKDGAVARLMARGAAERDEAGRPVRFVGSLMDVTEQREAEDAARLAGTRAQYALEAAELGLWQYDAKAGAVVMDTRLAQLLGRPDMAGETLDPATVFTFTAPEDLEAVKAEMAALNRGERDVIRSEHRVVDADGRRIWILAHVGAPERDGEGRPTRLIGITQDLTAQKQVEEALRDAKERAEAANEAKSAFLATMSHEIRTPLNGVLGMAQLLTLGRLDEKQARYAQTILSSGRTLSAIIDDVLDISRIEAGKMALDLQPGSISDMVSGAIEPSRSAAADKGLGLHVEIAEALDAPRVFDATRMGQVLSNLISNAVKFTDAGDIIVKAGLTASGLVRFEVCDNGPGVEPELHERIFERFTQADMSTRRAHGGSGLGLAIAKELVQLAGGHIGVDSVSGHGATFWFEIPAPVADGDDKDAEDDAAFLPGEGAGARVLVVEDHPVNRAATVELLDFAGFQCAEADSAEAGLALLRAQSFDAVLLDLHMPGQGGDTLLAAVRRGYAGAKDIPVFMVSADVTRSSRHEAHRLGADGYFSKPVDYETLRRTLTRAVNAARS